MTIPQKLDRLKKAGEAACRSACEEKSGGFLSAAANWADLHCRFALRCKDNTGRVWYEVLVEEAASDSSELQQYIAHKIKESEGMDVEVRTEW